MGTTAIPTRYKYYVDADTADQGAATTRSTQSILDIVTDIGTSVKAVLVLPNSNAAASTAYRVSTDLDLTTYGNIRLEVENGAVIKPATGITLTLLSPDHIVAPDTQKIISGAGTVAFARPGRLPSGWYGTMADGSTDNSGPFGRWATAMEATSHMVGVIPPGRYYTTGGISIDQSGISVDARGARVRGSNVSGYLVQFGSAATTAKRREMVTLEGGKWQTGGTTTGCLRGCYVTALHIGRVILQGTADKAVQIQGCWAGSIKDSHIHGKFVKGVEASTHRNTYVCNGFKVDNNWINGGNYASMTHGVHVLDRSTNFQSNHNYYENINARHAKALHVEHGIRVNCRDDTFEDCYTAVLVDTNENFIYNPILGGNSRDIVLTGNKNRVWYTTPQTMATYKTVAASGDDNIAEGPISSSTYMSSTGTDNRFFRTDSGAWAATASTDIAFGARIHGDSVKRLDAYGNGSMYWSNGTDAAAMKLVNITRKINCSVAASAFGIYTVPANSTFMPIMVQARVDNDMAASTGQYWGVGYRALNRRLDYGVCTTAAAAKKHLKNAKLRWVSSPEKSTQTMGGGTVIYLMAASTDDDAANSGQTMGGAAGDQVTVNILGWLNTYMGDA